MTDNCSVPIGAIPATFKGDAASAHLLYCGITPLLIAAITKKTLDNKRPAEIRCDSPTCFKIRNRKSPRSVSSSSGTRNELLL